MKRIRLIIALGFTPLLIVLGVIRITHIPIVDSLIAIIGCSGLSWALLNMFDAISVVYTMLDNDPQEVSQKEEDAEEMANQLTIAVLSKLHEMSESIDKEEG
mgnify:CR=1 FL=1